MTKEQEEYQPGFRRSQEGSQGLRLIIILVSIVVLGALAINIFAK